MSYNSDIIITDLPEMARFLKTAKQVKDDLSLELITIKKSFRTIENWDDDIHEKTDVVLDSINKKCEVIFDEIERLNNVFEDYLEILEDYNNPFSGKMSRF